MALCSLSLRSVATAGVFFTAVLAWSAPVIAQSGSSCVPWSKHGLLPLSYTNGDTMRVGSVAHGDDGIAFDFEFDAVCGVVLKNLAHRGRRPDGLVTTFDYPTDPPSNRPQGLWRARFRPLDSEDVTELFPDDADCFEVFVDHPTAPSEVVFRWSGLRLTPECDFISWMEVKLEVDGARSEWDSRLGRIACSGSEIFTLDEVLAPVIYTRQATNDARVLLPLLGRSPVPADNLPLAVWSFFNIDVELEHPARGQQMQWSAVHSPTGPDIPDGQGGTISPRGKTIYFGTEDRDGYYKRFRHAAVLDPTNFQLYYEWAPIYFPTYGPSPYTNFHRSRYPTVVCAIQSKSEAFWYDVCEHYREFVERRIRPRAPDSFFGRRNTDFPKASTFFASSTFVPVNLDIATIYDAYVDQALLVKDAFRGADGDVTPTFMEWQKWLRGNPTDAPVPGRVPEDPIGPDFNPAPFTGSETAIKEPAPNVIASVERAHANDINVSVYTLPQIIEANDWPTFNPDWFLRDRNGDFANEVLTGKQVDFGRFGVPWWYATNLYDDIFDTQPLLGGVFFDVFSGNGAFLRYPAQGEMRRLFRGGFHGGRQFVDGQERTAQLVRARIGGFRPNSHPDVPFMPSEVTTEYLGDDFDWSQFGLKPLPQQMQNQFLFDALVGVFDPFAPLDRTNPSPPLWNTVYHEWVRTEGLGTSLSTVGVEGFGTGLPYDTWGDYTRMVHALYWYQGMKATSWQYYFGLEPFNLLVERNGVADVKDPGNLDQLELLEFIQRLHRAADREDEAGQFLTQGRMLRPLSLTNSRNPFAITQTATPSFLVDLLTPRPDGGTRHFTEDTFSSGVANQAFGFLPYDQHHVLHQVWEAEDGTIGIVFVNWADEPSRWEGVFDPELYGLGPNYTVVGLRPDGAGVQEYAIGSGSGTQTFTWDAAPNGIALQHHAAAGPGVMPGRSVQVVLIR